MQTFRFDDAVRNPAVFAEGRLPARSDHVAYASAAELAAGESSLRLCLDGRWRFHYAKNHNFLLKVFKEILDHRADAKLLIVGENAFAGLFRTDSSRQKLSDSAVTFCVPARPKTLIFQGFQLFWSPFRGIKQALIIYC